MNYTYRTCRILAVTVSICWSVSAMSQPGLSQEKPSPPPHAHEHHQHATVKPPVTSDWATALQLSGEKADQVNAVEQEYHTRRRELVKKHYAEMMALEKSRLESLQPVLTPEQLAQLQTLWKARMKDAHSAHH